MSWLTTSGKAIWPSNVLRATSVMMLVFMLDFLPSFFLLLRLFHVVATAGTHVPAVGREQLFDDSEEFFALPRGKRVEEGMVILIRDLRELQDQLLARGREREVDRP